MKWDRRFINPINLPDGRKLVTLKDAAEYVSALPFAVQTELLWQHAAESLKNAAERKKTWMTAARRAMTRALGESTKAPLGNMEKEQDA
jgi:hypothetical protein